MVQTAKTLQGFDLVGLVEVINKEGIEDLVDELSRQVLTLGIITFHLLV